MTKNLKAHGFIFPNSSGRLIPLRTKAEVQAKLSLIDAYVVEIPLKAASEVVKCIKIPQDDGINFQHLCRFVKTERLPSHIQDAFGHSRHGKHHSSVSEPNAISSTLKASHQNNGESQVEVEQSTQQILHHLICATRQIPYEQVFNAISSSIPFIDGDKARQIHTIPVPAQPPTSQDQAREWSLLYWPTVYKKHNPNGAHPSIISRAEDEIRPLVGKWMGLAKQVGLDCHANNFGDPIGTVIVDTTTPGGPLVVAVAGDARWKGNNFDTRQGSQRGNGNVMAHSVMRAIGLVARKRRSLPKDQSNSPVESRDAEDFSQDYPLLPLETSILSQDTLKPGGYLCTDLEIYTTHEPCVMCSMAILQSRFEKVIFGRRMPRTGGLTAETSNNTGREMKEGGLGYGLFWLHKLNWKLLAWQWVADGGDGERNGDGNGDVGKMVLDTIHA